jgi:pimeloyl-ACP methyl ester carboxylesterase
MTGTHISTLTRFADRRWGNADSLWLPLLLLQHFCGRRSHWASSMTDGLAEGSEVILYNGSGIASSGGQPRTRVKGMADDAAGFVRALGSQQIDVLGFSMGGFQAQDVTPTPGLVSKRILARMSSAGGQGIDCVGVVSWTLMVKGQLMLRGPGIYLTFTASVNDSQAASALLKRLKECRARSGRGRPPRAFLLSSR